MWDDVVEETPAPAAAAQPASDAPAGEAAGEDKPEVAEPPPPVDNTKNEPRRLVFKHWIRPKFLQYNYIYDYQRNYYDDVLSYLDRRNRGLPVERPRAQTWGERALRTYLSKDHSYTAKTYNTDTTLLHHISSAARFQRYHSKARIARKYSNLGFSSVSL
ncbi:Flightin [Papilio machaon]|uniref:Flightin n=1 Tax=Papilio machaon TaxID=76193 RepID=A0A194QLG5_PAPMA|nr:Flightin [Papilio machaon]